MDKKEAAKNLSPTNSPIMFDTFHALYVWFQAVEQGNIKPLIDFLVDGKYDRNFIEAVKPDFPASRKTMYLI